MLDPIGPQGLSRLGPQPWPGREPGSPAHRVLGCSLALCPPYHILAAPAP